MARGQQRQRQHQISLNTSELKVSNSSSLCRITIWGLDDHRPGLAKGTQFSKWFPRKNRLCPLLTLSILSLVSSVYIAYIWTMFSTNIAHVRWRQFPSFLPSNSQTVTEQPHWPFQVYYSWSRRSYWNIESNPEISLNRIPAASALSSCSPVLNWF